MFFFAFLVSCMNDTKVSVPDKIQHDVKDSVQTVNVVHTIGLSFELTSMFTGTCTTEVDKLVPPLPEPMRTEAINSCVADATRKLIESLTQRLSKETENNVQNQ